MSVRALNRLVILLSLSAVIILAFAAQLDPAAEIPSYRAALEEFRAQRSKAKDSPIRPEDRRVMDRAARNLAAAMPDPGLRVGDRAPDFVLPNASGQEVRLADRLAQGPVILTFYRGAWCPYCNLQLRGLAKALPYIEAEGAELLAVSPQLPDKSLQQVQDEGYPFEILSDLDDRVMRAYGLFFEVPEDLSRVYQQRLALDLAEYNGEGRYVLPVPATFVIDGDGVIRAAFANVDYRQRPEPAEIIAALRGLNPRPDAQQASKKTTPTM